MADQYQVLISGQYDDGSHYSGNFSFNASTGAVTGRFTNGSLVFKSFTLVSHGNSYALVSSASSAGVMSGLRISFNVDHMGPGSTPAIVTERAYSCEGYVVKSGHSSIEACYACFCSGTRILTERGAVPVEQLRVADMLITASGAHRPVKWIGHRTLEIAGQSDAKSVWPVRVESGAFGANNPHRDLWLSPAHAVKVGGFLVQINRLLNEATIAQVPRDKVTYWHVELESHDVILAEGLEVESYLDTGNRAAFVDGDAFFAISSDLESRMVSQTCLPFVGNGADLVGIRADLLRRAEDFGYSWSDESDLHIVADGARINPTRLEDRSFAFDLPESSRTVALVSRTWTPARSTADVQDYRTLGVCVGVLHVDGRDLLLASLNEGWSDYETDGVYEQRWTMGEASLPAGSRRVIVHVNLFGRYLSAPDMVELAAAA